MVFYRFKEKDFNNMIGNAISLIFFFHAVTICLPLQTPLEGLYSVGVHIKLVFK